MKFLLVKKPYRGVRIEPENDADAEALRQVFGKRFTATICLSSFYDKPSGGFRNRVLIKAVPATYKKKKGECSSP